MQQHDDTERSALIAVPGSRGRGVPTREYNRDLRPYVTRGINGRPGLYEEMVAGSPRIRRGMTALFDLHAAAEWRLEAADGSTQAAITRAAIEHALFRSLSLNADDADAGRWEEFLRLTCWRYQFGFALFEVRRASATEIECFPIHPSSVQSWRLDESGVVREVYQSTEWGRAEIAGEDLLHLTHGAQGVGDVEGQSLLRPLIFPHETYQSEWMAMGRRSLADGGIIVVTENDAPDQTSREQIIEYLREFDRGDRQSLVLPHGYTHEVQFPGGSAGQSLETLRYIDALVDMTLYQSQQALGATAGSGSRALGESLERADFIRLSQMLEEHARLLSTRLIPHVGRLLGLPGPYPVLTAVSVEEQWRAEDGGSAEAHRDEVTAPAHSMSCRHEWSDGGDPVRMVDAGGRELMLPRSAFDEELCVRWGDLDDERARLDARIEREVEELAQDLRADLLVTRDRIVEQGGAIGDYEAASEVIADRYVERAEGLIAEHEERVRDMLERETDAEAAEQIRRGMVESGRGASPEDIARIREEALAREIQIRHDGARTIVQRVAGEVSRAVAGSIPTDEFESRITPAGLALEAKSAGHQVEAMHRIVGRPPAGMAIAEVVRSSMLEFDLARGTMRVCGHCLGRDGVRFVMPEDLDALRAERVPDPRCEGGIDRCRCVLLVRYVREGA